LGYPHEERKHSGFSQNNIHFRWPCLATLGLGRGCRSINRPRIADGSSVIAWNWDPFGQVDVPAGLTNGIAVAAGGNHSLALTSESDVQTWGDNFYGQSQPRANLSNVVQVAAGVDHSLALRFDGSVVTWGWGGMPEDLSNIVLIGAMGTRSLAVQAEGTPINPQQE
jgi:alpha-tubulin suppressor-like RCC1 family protein